MLQIILKIIGKLPGHLKYLPLLIKQYMIVRLLVKLVEYIILSIMGRRNKSSQILRI